VSEMVKPGVEAVFEERTNTVSYLVWDPGSKQSVVIDPVLDFDPRNGRVSVKSADAILAAAENAGLKIIRVLETHAHADHLSAAPYIKQKTGATVGIGEHIRDVQRILVRYSMPPIFQETARNSITSSKTASDSISAHCRPR